MRECTKCKELIGNEVKVCPFCGKEYSESELINIKREMVREEMRLRQQEQSNSSFASDFNEALGYALDEEKADVNLLESLSYDKSPTGIVNSYADYIEKRTMSRLNQFVITIKYMPIIIIIIVLYLVFKFLV